MHVLFVLVSYALQGLTGFGSAPIMVSVFTQLEGPRTAIALTTVFDCVTGLAILWWRRKAVAVRSIWVFLLGMVLGTPIGLVVATRVDAAVLKPLIGVVVLLSALLGLWRSLAKPGRNKRIDELSRKERAAGFLAAFLSGVAGAAVGIAGPPFIIYCQHFLRKEFFRDALVVIFGLGATVRLACFALTGLVTPVVVHLSLTLGAVALAGLILGMLLHLKVSEKWFGVVTAVLLCLFGLWLLI